MADNQPQEKHFAEFVLESIPFTDPVTGKEGARDEIMLKVTYSKNHIVCRRMEDADKARFERAWAIFNKSQAFKSFHEGDDNEVIYTPLDTLDGIGPTKLKQLQDANIRSVEQLAEADDEAIEHIKGYESLRNKALERVTAKV